MSWDNDAAGYLAELARSPGARQPATFGEVWNSEWKRGALDTVYGVEKPFNDARDEFVAAIEGAAGKPLKDYALERGIRVDTAVTPAQEQALLGQIADTLPEDRRKQLEPLRDIRLNAAKKAQKIEAEAEDVSNATYGLSGHAVAFIAGVARQSVDPVNLIAMAATGPIGGGARAGLARTIGREALANAGAQAVVEPAIEPARAELGLENGFGRAAGNVFEAGIGGGVLSGVFHLAGRGARAGYRALRSPPERVAPEGAIVAPEPQTRAGDSRIAPEPRSEAVADPAPAEPAVPPSPADQFGPDDFHAAGELAARDHVVDAMSPVDTAEGRIDHAAKVDAAAERIDAPGRVSPDITVSREVSDQIDAYRKDGLFIASDEAVSVTSMPMSAFDGETIRASQMSVDAAGVKYWKRQIESGSRPAILIEQVSAGKFQIVDAHTRATAYAQAGIIDVPVIVKQMEGQRQALAARKPVDPDDIVTQEVRAKKPRGRAAAHPQTWSLFEFLASKGGLKPTPDLEAILGSKRGPFVPGFGPLIRKKGRNLDDALVSAMENFYFIDPSSMRGSVKTVNLNHLLRAIDDEQRGLRRYRLDHLPKKVIDAEQEAHIIRGALEKEIADSGGDPATIDTKLTERVVEIVQKEGERDVLAAFERAIMEDVERFEGLAAARQADAELAKIPGWDVDDAGAAPRDGQSDPKQRGQAERAGQGDVREDGEPPRAAGQSDREPGDGSPRQLGDPALAADAARVLEEAGGDIEITLQNPDGSTRTVRASDALREAEADAKAADELNACITGAETEEPPF